MLVYKIAGMPLTEPKAFVIHNGTDFVPYSNFKKLDNIEIVVMSVVGKMWRCKGLDILAKVLNKVCTEHPDIAKRISVLIVGEPAKQVVEGISYSCPDVHVLKSLPKQVLKEIYRKTHILIQLSRFDSFLLPAIEAASQGSAIIVSNRAGVAEILRDSAIIVDIKRLDDIYDTLLRLITSEELRDELSLRALKLSYDYTYDKVAKRYLLCYLKVLKQAL